MTTQKPLISVVMPVYNAGDFLRQAIESIQSQTYTNWELIAVDDNSTDSSYKNLKKYAQIDKRIRVFKNQQRLGVSGTANFALTKVRGQLLARMDADDISMPNRFEKQVSYLLTNPDVVVVGTQCTLIDTKNNVIGEKRFPIEFDRIKKMIFWSIPVQQPSMMINITKLPKDFVWYDGAFTSAEEVELLFKLFKVGKVTNLPDVLLKYRIHEGNTSLKNPKETFYLTFHSRIKAVTKYGYRPTVVGVIYSIMQLALVTFLPKQVIYPLYAFVRGVKRQQERVESRLQVASLNA